MSLLQRLVRSSCIARNFSRPRLGPTRPYYTPAIPPPLFDLCVRQDFTQALERVRSHPHEARFKHPRGWTALHCCVEHVAPLDLVQALCEAHPPALSTKDWNGKTPVESAVDPATKEFLQKVMDGGKWEPTVPLDASSVEPHVDLQKVLKHVNEMGAQVESLRTTSESLQKELDALKATLRSLAKK